MISQITISEVQRPRRLRRALLFGLPLLALAWYIAAPEWDYYTSYSGVVVRKGMDCGLCLFSHRHSLELYIVLRDSSGKQSKRYVGDSYSYTDTKNWNAIGVGEFVVKDKGYGEYPYEPGKKPPYETPSASESHPWLFVGILTGLAIFMAIRLRQFWNDL